MATKQAVSPAQTVSITGIALTNDSRVIICAPPWGWWSLLNLEALVSVQRRHDVVAHGRGPWEFVLREKHTAGRGVLPMTNWGDAYFDTTNGEQGADNVSIGVGNRRRRCPRAGPAREGAPASSGEGWTSAFADGLFQVLPGVVCEES